MSQVLTGLDVVVREDFARFRGQRVGLVTHPAAVDNRFDSAETLFATHTNLVTLFGPEHGFTGEAQDLIPVGDDGEAGSGVRRVSLYGDSFASLNPTPEVLKDLDVLVIDLQDVGSRYYTFQATMLYCLEAAAPLGLPVVVLDRPNPIGGDLIEGPTIQPGFESFVGCHPVPIRYGLTVGELARLYRAERVPGVDLTVVPCEGWRRADAWEWVLPPSPNMPTANTALVYPGMCLVEGTNLSEGRGTTRPFEYVGHPDVDPRAVAMRLNGMSTPGVAFMPVMFRPTFQKHAGQSCGGVFLHVTDAATFRPVRTGLAVLTAFRAELGGRFCWRTERYEFVEHLPAIDILFGSDRERLSIEGDVDLERVVEPWVEVEASFRRRREPFLLYP
jgi:uncharacterized protein YbbC (DUF1343 family)